MKEEEELELTRNLQYYHHFFVENLQYPATVWQAIVSHRQTGGLIYNGNLSGNGKYEVDSNDEKCVQLHSLLLQLPGNPTAEFIHAQLSSPKIRTILSIQSLQDILDILNGTDNKILATLLTVDPYTVSVGSLHWDKIVFDLWTDLILVNFDELSTFLLLEQAIFPTETERTKRKFSDNKERMVQLICILAQRYQDLDILQKALYFLGTVNPFCLGLADKMGKMDVDEFEWMQWHRDIFISMASQQLDNLILELTRRTFLTALDLKRIERLKNDECRAKYVFDTLQRKPGQMMYSLITACHQSGLENLAYLMKLQPIDIQIPWPAFQLIQFNWTQLIRKVSYEKVVNYLVSRNFMRYKDHLQCKLMGNNEERMRFVLKLVVTRDGEIYDAFFHILSLQPGLSTLFQKKSNGKKLNKEDLQMKGFPMSFEEKKIILECQDFLAQNIQNTDQVCRQLVDAGLLATSDLEYINKMSTVLTQNLAILQILKRKSSGTVTRLLSILWKTRNRNCAEILGIDFQNFQMSIEEWLKLKSNWVEIVKTVNLDFVCPTLLNTGVISEEENQWIERSSKNRQKMRKLLRILPNKKRGYKILLLALSQYEDYQELLLKCQPMDLWQLKRLQENVEFLTENTINLTEILQELVSRKLLTDNEAKLITCYQEPVEELYMTLMGKDNRTLSHLIETLELTDNLDAAAILRIDLFSIILNSIEWLDYQRMWLDFLDEIKYTDTRESFIFAGLISTAEDNVCLANESNDARMRVLLQILPYRQGGFQSLVQMMLESCRTNSAMR